MELATGELSSLGGKMLLMTATATKKTMKILQAQFPEITKWGLILNMPVRSNVTYIVPPPDCISSKFETILRPFITRMKIHEEKYLIIVRGVD